MVEKYQSSYIIDQPPTTYKDWVELLAKLSSQHGPDFLLEIRAKTSSDPYESARVYLVVRYA